MYRFIPLGFSLFILCRASELDIHFKSEDHIVHPDNDLFKNGLFSIENAMKMKNQLENLQYNPVHENHLFKSLNLLPNSSQCLQDLLYAVNSLNGLNEWALYLFDSYGKPDSGILKGSLKWPGELSECIEVYAPKDPNSTAGHFHGQYCSMTWNVTFANITLPIISGVCVPDSCSSSELQTLLKLLIGLAFPASGKTKSPFQINSLMCIPSERHLNAASKAIIAVLSFFCTLAVLGSSITAVKYFLQTAKETEGQPFLLVNTPPKDPAATLGDTAKEDERDDRNDKSLQQNGSSNKVHGYLRTVEAFLGCFCVFTNGAKLLNTDDNEGQLLCIHGIRFLSMSWVILGHTYSSFFAEIRNSVDALKLANTFPIQIIFQSLFSVDSFFVLSGFLLTYLSMREFAKGKGISWPYFYIHRYLRLTPLYMLTLGFSVSVFLYMGSGPLWTNFEIDPECRRTWWTNLLYINNLKEIVCMPWSWYLANDMQFFIISPLFLITLWRWPKIGYSLLAFFLGINCLANFIITYKFDLIPGLVGHFETVNDVAILMERFNVYYDKLYIKPYTRIGPYLFGMFAGYIVHRRKINKTPQHNWITLGLGWAVASSITLTCVYGLYHKNPSLLARSFYNCFNRSLFGAGLSWVIYVCLIDQGGFVNSILSYKLFIPLSRLTYVAYLIHPFIIILLSKTMTTIFQFSHANVVFLYLGLMVVTYALSLPVALVFESPLILLEKMIRKSFSKEKKSGV